jgi:hypothetical protein
VLFWADTTTHHVLPTAPEAAPRLALSFWYIGENGGATGNAGTFSPLV